MSLKEIRENIVPVLERHGIRRAGLFGSVARDELRPDSDIDILIDTHNEMGLLKMVSMKNELEDRLQRKVDLVEYRAIKPALRERIMAEQVFLV